MKRRARPWITANFAVTLDGKISTRAFTPSLFTSPRDKERLEEIRAPADAVLAARGTVAADTMSMGLSRKNLRDKRRAAGLPPVPLRVVVSNRGRLDPAWKVFQNRQSPLVVFSTTRMPATTRDAVAPLCDLFLFPDAGVQLRTALEILRRDYGVRSLVCEGGATLFRSLVADGLVDELFVTLAPVVFGGAGAPTLTGLPGDFLPEAGRFRVVSLKQEGGECFVHLRRRGLKRG